MSFFANAIKNLAHRMGGQASLKQPKSSATETVQKIIDRLAIVVKSEPVSGTDKWHFNCEFKCRACGGSVVYLPDNYTDESTASCRACGVEFGPWGKIKVLATVLAEGESQKHGRTIKEGVDEIVF